MTLSNDSSQLSEPPVVEGNYLYSEAGLSVNL